MCDADTCLVTLERGEVVVVGAEADVSVGAHGEECGALDAEEISCDGVEVFAQLGQVRTGAEGDGRFEQGRLGGELVEESRRPASAVPGAVGPPRSRSVWPAR